MKRFLFLSAVLLNFLAPRLFALGSTQDWQLVSGAAAPWQSAVAIATYGSQFLVLSDTGNVSSSARLWLSTDGDSWQPVTDSSIQGDSFWAFAEHGGWLYGFAVDQGGNRLAFRTQNGSTWQAAGSFGGGSRWSSAISFSGNLYVAAHSGETWKSSGSGTPPSWTSVTYSPGVAGTDPEFAVLAGYLYTVQTNGSFSIATVSRSADGIQWDVLHQDTRSDTAGFFGLAIVGNELWWGAAHCQKTTVADPTQWTDAVLRSENSVSIFGECSPFSLFDQSYVGTYRTSLFGLSFDSAVRQADAISSWPIVFNSARDIFNATLSDRANRKVQWRDHVFLLTNALWRLNLGVRSLLQVPLVNTLAVRGNSNFAVLAVTPRVQIQDSLHGWRIRNLGSARAGSDISALSLFRVAPGNPGVDQPSELLGGFNADGDSAWTLALSNDVVVHDGDVLVVSANVASTAGLGRTIRMRSDANAINWVVTSTSAASPTLGASADQTVATNAGQISGEIAEMEAAPQPAKDDVHFFYTLSSPSDIQVRIFDREGRLVSKIDDNQKSAALHAETVWNASSVGPGVYFAAITINSGGSPERVYKKKIVIQR